MHLSPHQQWVRESLQYVHLYGGFLVQLHLLLDLHLGLKFDGIMPSVRTSFIDGIKGKAFNTYTYSGCFLACIPSICPFIFDWWCKTFGLTSIRTCIRVLKAAFLRWTVQKSVFHVHNEGLQYIQILASIRTLEYPQYAQESTSKRTFIYATSDKKSAF